MELDEEGSPDGAGERYASLSEKALQGLKQFAEISMKDCRTPCSEAAGSAYLRTEIHSTWMLLMCLHHAEAEADTARATWTPGPWRTEAEALRHISLSHQSVRVLRAVLRWLSWSHRLPTVSGEEEDDADVGVLHGSAGYERTRRKLQLRGALAVPLQGPPALHPDGPLDLRDQFHTSDLQDEQKLLRQVFSALRRKDLKRAWKLCEDSGQAWRIAFLQGLMPHADGAEAAVSYDTMDDGGDELLANLKEQHADWTELGAVESSSSSEGNPWRRVWKEQCWDAAQRNLHGSSSMDPYELAILGFCAGHYDALIPACQRTWADRCWGELHCLKEWLVERLLEDGRAEWSKERFIGEGDGGCRDPADTGHSQALRSEKLCGRLRAVPSTELEDFVASHVCRLLQSLPPEGLGHGASIADRFARLQAMLIEAVWRPERADDAIALLSLWVGRDGGEAVTWTGAPEGCPFMVKQFASYLALWQREHLHDIVAFRDHHLDDRPFLARQRAIEGTEDAVEHIVQELVNDYVKRASGPSWSQEVLEGDGLHLVAEHAKSLKSRGRIEAFSTLIFNLGAGASLTDGSSATDPDGQLHIRAQALRRCLEVFWDTCTEDVFGLAAELVTRALRVKERLLLGEDRFDGIKASVRVEDMQLAILCLVLLWVAGRTRSDNRQGVKAALIGLEHILGEPFSQELLESMTDEDFFRTALDLVVGPLLTDCLACLVTKEPNSALRILEPLRASTLWNNIFSSDRPCKQQLAELEWFMELCQLHQQWTLAHQEAVDQRCAAPPRLAGFGSSVRVEFGGMEILEEAERRLKTSHSNLLQWALSRLESDLRFLEPHVGSHTLLDEQQWTLMKQGLAWRVVQALLESYELEGDYDGALQELAVAMSQSPWLLKLLRPEHARAFLHRLALVPSHPSPSRGHGLWE